MAKRGRKSMMAALQAKLVKKQQQPAGPPKEREPLTISQKLRVEIDKIREPFLTFAESFAGIVQGREILAPTFMKTFGMFVKETAGTFVQFVHELDPNVPLDREGYRANSVYQAADYLRRLQAQTARSPGDKEKDLEHKREISPATLAARLAATLVNLVDKPEQFWEVLQAETGMTDAELERFQSRVLSAVPIFAVPDKSGFLAKGIIPFPARRVGDVKAGGRQKAVWGGQRRAAAATG